MSKYSLGRIEAIIAQLQSADAAGREKYLEHLESTDPNLLEEVLRFIGDVEEGFLEDTSERIREAVSPGTDLIGRTIQHYRIEDVLGRGGMGVVYKARDTELRRDVALKFLPLELRKDEKARRRFMDEGRAVARLDHPNICGIFGVEKTEAGVPFLVMALYEGNNLRERLLDGPLSISEAESILTQTAAGLSAAHAEGLIHRDIKPENLFITNGGTVKILDFGIASVLDDSRASDGDGMMGTVAYMSPEQTREESATEQSDLWALGAVGYEMVTGRSPFDAADQQGAIHRIRNDEPDDLPPETPRRLARIIDKCLRKNPARRPSEARDVEEFLKRTRGLGRVPPRAKKVMAVVIVAALGTGLWLGLLLGIIEVPGRDHKPVLDVVPIVDSMIDSMDIAVAYGLSEVLRDDLGRTREVDVRDGYSGHEDLSTYVRDVARDRNRDVDYVLGVEIAISDDVVRLKPELYSENELIWGDGDYRFRQNDFHEARELVLRDILTWLKVELDAASQQVDIDETDNPEANIHYLRGRGHLKRRTPAALQEAIRQFRAARSLDPDFASAAASLSLAIALSQSTGFVVEPDSEKYMQARVIAQRAIELDSTNELAHLALGFVLHNFDWNWAAAARQYELASQINPQNADVLHFYSTHRAERGDLRLSDASDMQYRATVLSPEVKNYFAGYAMHLYLDGKNKGVLDLAKEWPADFANFFVYRIWEAFALMDEGEFEEAEAAISAFEEATFSEHPMALHLRGRWHARRGHDEDALRYADLLREKFPTLVASIYHELGDTEAALTQLEIGLKNRSTYMTIIGVWPSLGDLRTEPRFQYVLREMGLDNRVDR